MIATDESPAHAAQITVVIPTWNGMGVLPQCLAGVGRLVGTQLRVIVVDDASDDGTADWLAVRHPDVLVIKQPTRRGFASAVNAGLRRSSTPYVALLNNDAVPEPRWLEASIQTLEASPTYGVCVPRITYADAPTTINSVGLYLRWYGASGDIGIGKPDGSTYDQRAEVFGFTGCAVVFRSHALEAVGMLDEWLEAYCEDLDWTLRARAVGIRFVYCPDARVRHRGSATFRRIPDRAVFLQCRNSVVVLARHVPFRSALRSALGLAAFHIYHVAVNVARGQGLSAMRGKIAGIRHALSRAPSGAGAVPLRVGDSLLHEDPLRSGPPFRVIERPTEMVTPHVNLRS